MDGVVSWLKELTIFMVICETILSFAPTAVYKRYIKPFVGLIILLWITSFLFGAIEIDWNQRVDSIFTEYEQAVSHYLENVPIVDEDIAKDKLMEEYTAAPGLEEGKILNDDIIKVDNIVINPIKIGVSE